MSADNGVYVLESPIVAVAPDGQEVTVGNEYRVAHCQAIDNLYAVESIAKYYEYEIFKDSEVYYDKDEALLAAHRIAERIPVLEYGVNLIKMGHPFPTKEQVGG